MKTLTLTILQFNTFIKNILDAEEFLTNISVVGEVTNFKISGGHAYFDLKDENAMLSCVKFGASDLNIKNGDLVTVFGKVNFYVKSGRLNFLVSRTESYGLGDLYQKFLQLKEKLGKEGLFAEEIKKEIPKFAKRIGVVTSETGAVIRDIINVTRSKNPYTDIVIYPSKVQGVGAENDLIAGIEYFNTRDDIDTIIIARGGGSLEDLSPFNTEKIVRAIYNSSLPIISAVGHETDFTLCDFASDLRVPTPSVAAEVAVFNFYEQIQNIELLNKNMYNLVASKIIGRKEQLSFISDSMNDKLKLKLSSATNEINQDINIIDRKIENVINSKKQQLEIVTTVLSKLNPLEILKNGYGAIEKGNKKINNIDDIIIGEDIKVNMLDGVIFANVTNLKKK